LLHPSSWGEISRIHTCQCLHQSVSTSSSVTSLVVGSTYVGTHLPTYVGM
jgi:hypothetical protein